MSHPKSPASAQMQAYYAARTPYYDAVYSKPERRHDIEFLAKHLPQRFMGRHVLEVACGTGYWTQHIAPAAARMVATDATAEPLEFARLRPGTSEVTFLQADAYDLPSTLGRFDAAFAGLWFSHVPVQAREVFLQRLHEHLQPRSRVVFIDNGPVQLREFPIAETDADGNTYQLRPLRDGTVHRVLKNFPSADELRALLVAREMRVDAATVSYRTLENFWLIEYEIGTA